MILETYISLDLYGENFSPYQLSEATALAFDNVIEKGVTPVTTGKYKGQTAPYGSASIDAVVTQGNDYNEVLYTILHNFYQATKVSIQDSSLERITLWITFRVDKESQFGFEITPDNLLLIGQIKATLAVNISI